MIFFYWRYGEQFVKLQIQASGAHDSKNAINSVTLMLCKKQMNRNYMLWIEMTKLHTLTL